MTTWSRGTLAGRDWTQGGHPLESKKLDPASPSVVALRFEPGFQDPNWCEASHLIWVTQGQFTLELAGEVLTLDEGAFIRLAKGTRHRAANRSAHPVELFVVSHLEAGS